MSGGGRPPGDAPRTFRRSASSRLLGTGCALLFLAGAVSFASARGAGPGFFVLAGLTLLALANALGAWADRYTFSDSGIEYRNALLGLLGARPRLVPWEDVVEAREHRSLRMGRLEARPSAVFLVLRSGRRFVLDSLDDLDEAIRRVRRRRGTGDAGPQ